MKKRNSSKKKGFTLVELIVVILIIGILAAIAIPAVSGFRNSADDGRIKAEHRQLVSAIQMWQSNQTDPSDMPTNIDDLAPYINGGIDALMDGKHTYASGVLTSDLAGADDLVYPAP